MFFLSSQCSFQSVVYKLQVCLFFHIFFRKKRSHGTDHHRLMAHLNLPGRQSRRSCQCVSLSLQRSMQCHLQCTSVFGNVTSNLFQPMKWSSWLTPIHENWVRYKERLLFKPEGVFDANVIDQQGAIIILFQNIVFIVSVNGFSLLYQLCLLDSPQKVSKARSKQSLLGQHHFWVKS